jgi:hypothetical protein
MLQSSLNLSTTMLWPPEFHRSRALTSTRRPNLISLHDVAPPVMKARQSDRRMPDNLNADRLRGLRHRPICRDALHVAHDRRALPALAVAGGVLSLGLFYLALFAARDPPCARATTRVRKKTPTG